MRSRATTNLSEGAGGGPPDLSDALADLGDAVEEAKEDGLPIPSPELLDASERLLRKLHEVWPPPVRGLSHAGRRDCH